MTLIPIARDASGREWAYDDFLWTHSEPVHDALWPQLFEFLKDPHTQIAEWGGRAPESTITLTTRYRPEATHVTSAGKSASNVAIMEGPPLEYRAPHGSAGVPGSDGEGWRITYTLLPDQRKCYIHFPVRLGGRERLQYVAWLVSQPQAVINQVNHPDAEHPVEKVVYEVHDNGQPQPSDYTVTVVDVERNDGPTPGLDLPYASRIRWAVQGTCATRCARSAAAPDPTPVTCDPACCTLVTNYESLNEEQKKVTVWVRDAWYLCYALQPVG